ncbi:MAG TPA: glycosyltransferase [Solirubrobacterales bacterium]|nr:glycosyltransferase [Solirubrobacterales bacterium]
MKVLIATDTVGGVFTYTSELGAELEAGGDEVVVATMGPAPREEQRRRLPARVHESEFRLEWMEDPWDDVAAAGEWLLSLAEEERPDVVHLCSYAHGALPFEAPKVLVAHSCVLSWWRAVHGCPAPAEWDRYRQEMSKGLRGADVVVAPTRAMLAEVERDHELRPGSGTVINNGSSTPPMGLKGPYIDRNRPVVGGERPLVVGSGRFWDPAKNLAALDAAAEGLAWPVVVAGEMGDAAPTHARSAGLLDRAALAELRRGAAIYAAPAVYEPFGLGILEAARDRCALVLGDIPSLRELWEGAAVFVDPRDERRLRWALEELIEDGTRREELAARAQRRAAGYGVARSARAYRRLYDRLRSVVHQGVAA